MRRDQRMPWGYNGGNGTARVRMAHSPSPAAGIRRSSSPAPRVHSRRSTSPSSSRQHGNRQPAAVLQRRLQRETREDSGMACLLAVETNRTHDALEARVQQLENALRAEQEGTGKLYATLAQLRQDNSQLRDLANLVDMTKQGRDGVAGVRKAFGAATPVVGFRPGSAHNLGIGIEEIPVRSSADPIPGSSKALLIGASYQGTPHELPNTDESIYNLFTALQSSGFAAEYTILDSTTPATKHNIFDGIAWLVDDAQPGDSLVFAFCGHGVQITGAVSKLSGIAPIDWEAEDIISELDLKKIMLEALPAGVKLTCIFDLVGGGVGISMPNVLVINQGGIKEDSDVVPSPSAAHVITICHAWSTATAPCGSLTKAFSTTLIELGPELMMADFLNSLASRQPASIRVGSSALELKPTDVFCFGVLPVHRGPRTSVTKSPNAGHHASPVPSASTPAPHLLHHDTGVKKDSPVVGSKALVVGSNTTLVSRFLTRQGINASVQYASIEAFGEEHLRWLTDDAMPGDSMFLCMTCSHALRWSLSDIMYFLVQELPQGVRLTWVAEFEAPLSHPPFENYVIVTNEGLQHVDSQTHVNPLVMCISGKTGLVSAYMAAMNRDPEPTVSHLATSMATIMASSCFDEYSSLSELNIRLSCSKRWSLLSKMHLGLLPCEGKRAPDVPVVQLDSSSLPPTPRAAQSKPIPHPSQQSHGYQSTMPPISTPAAPAQYGTPGPVPVPAPIPASFMVGSTPVMAASLPPPEAPVAPTSAASPPPPSTSPIAGAASEPRSEAPSQPCFPNDRFDVYEQPRQPSVPTETIPSGTLEPERLSLVSHQSPPKSHSPFATSHPLPSQRSQRSPSLSPTQQNCKKLLVDFCSRYDTSNLPDVDTMLQDHAGNEELLLEAVALRAGMPGYFIAKKKVTDYYVRVNPGKMEQVDTILSEYVGAWDELYRDLEERYGEPFEQPGSSMPYRDLMKRNSPKGSDAFHGDAHEWRGRQEYRELNRSPHRSVSPSRSPAKALARPIQFDTTQDTIEPQYLQGTQAPYASQSASPYNTTPTLQTHHQPTRGRTDDDLIRRRSEAEERYLALKEQMDSYTKRVAALKESKPADAQAADFLAHDWRHM
eukprot:TRINITY_DN21033_c0_g1_i1.p1 TRINITY_DN21033_c0_g1~~TRINITY_DN21033_c0_g1_i1.p1  ORF type:complete len:1114 (+),score=218.07 TRINITY_DN21033_c0_g1_i1:170-3511(+)